MLSGGEKDAAKDEGGESENQKLLPSTGLEAFEIEKVKEEQFESKAIGERSWEESKKMWEIALPAILTSVAQFLIGFFTIAFVGHLGQVELAAVAVVQNVIEGFLYGIMVFAYALNFPLQKFLQAQSAIWVMTLISLLVTLFHIVLSWALVLRFGFGLHGAAMAENISWWLLVLAQIVYVVSGYFPESWTGFSLSAFTSLYEFVKLSLASAVILECWYPTVVILLVGLLPNPQIAVDSISICMNLQLWAMFISLGFSAAVSVRVGNELGAGNAKAAKFSVVVTVITSTIVGVVLAASVIATADYFPVMFSNDPEVIRDTVQLGYYLAVNILISSIQPVLHGVAVGAGWQNAVAVVNIVSYYVIGLPVGMLLGFKGNFGVKGMWIGMLAGIILQTAAQAEERVLSWSSDLSMSKDSKAVMP
ncbi:hypothetical protein V2J09_016599 [Rumex salicifolius]